ncbi:unnamed protein product, partial [Callosobruchus maculatus]
MDKEKLITSVFVREAIWDKTSKNHHNSLLLTRLWKEVAVECNTTVTLAKSQWKRVRETFRKKLAEMPEEHSGDGAEDSDSSQPNWQHFNSLLFLKDQCVPRKSTGNFEITGTEAFQVTEDTEIDNALNSMEEIVNETESRPTTSSSLSNSQHITPVAPALKRANTQKTVKTADAVGEALLKAEEEKIAYLKRKEEIRSKREEKELDDDEAFFKSILPYVKAMHPKQKLRFRIQVLQLINSEIPTQSSMQSNYRVVPGGQPRVYDISATQEGQQVFPVQLDFQSGSNVDSWMAITQDHSSDNVLLTDVQ